VCYFLYLASPLTLSEVRSMLPRGLTADLADFQDQQRLKAIHPAAQTVARILWGRCSCDLVQPRLADTRADERHLRERYRRLGVPRAAVIAALERHRDRRDARPTTENESRVLAEFVSEHARNAGPSLYYLHFSAPTGALSQLGSPRRLRVDQVVSSPQTWLTEGAPTLVSRS
jgi:GNAT superfamily N-acetyltransferase